MLCAAQSPSRGDRMIVATCENIAGQRVREVKGQCFGVVVRSRGIGGNIMAGLRSIAGGEIHEYTSMIEEARRQAIDRMVQNATAMGGNPPIMLRFDSPAVAPPINPILPSAPTPIPH